MRIAHLTYTYLPLAGGGDTYLAQLAAALGRQGHAQLVFQRRASGLRPPPGVAFAPNPLQGRGGEFWTQAAFLPLLRRELLSQDLLLCHYPPYLLAAALATLGARRPRLAGISHGVFWDDRPGSVRSQTKRAISRLAFRLADLYVANDSNFLREMGIALAPGQLMFQQVGPGAWFIPNCVDTERFSPGSGRPELAGRSIILVPRNLFRNRGVHLAIRAFALLAPEYPEATLLVAGADSQPAYAAYCRELARPLGERAAFMGPVDWREMPSLYRSAQLTLIPSLCGEGTSLAALESMACGVATISTDAGGLADLPTWHAKANPEALAGAVREVYPDRRTLGQRQREAVALGFNLGRWESAWAEAILNLKSEM